MRGSAKTAGRGPELPPGGATKPERRARGARGAVEPVRPLAVALRSQSTIPAEAGDVLLIAADERRAEEIARALRALDRTRDVLLFQPWDCLPYDRASPSREVMGTRNGVLFALAQPDRRPCLVVSCPEAVLQKVAPPSDSLKIAEGEGLDRRTFERFAQRTGYLVEHSVDDPGEIALQGLTIDIYPAAADLPVRILLDQDDTVQAIRSYDPVTQRTAEAVHQLVLLPASEVTLKEGIERETGVEHRLPAFRKDLVSLFSIMGDAAIVVEPDTVTACEAFRQRIEAAYESRLTMGGREDHAPTAPDHLYLPLKSLKAALKGRLTVSLEKCEDAPAFALETDPTRALGAFAKKASDKGIALVIAGLAHERAKVRRLLKSLKIEHHDVEAVTEAKAKAKSGAVSLLDGDFDAGVIDEKAALAVVAAADIFGSRLADTERAHALPGARSIPEPGDVVVHEDHGVAILRGLKSVEVDDGTRDMLALEYHGGDTLLVPVENFDLVWRYGSEPDGVTLDRLHTDGWNKRRVKVSGYVEEAAARLVEMAAARAAAKTKPVVPPKTAFARFSAGFAFPETPDQKAAIADVLRDLASGRPMNRLICGDVGFGKTEVALRAAAAVALGGRQVALVAPTTVLARQHVETFRQRFAGSGVDVVHLSRFASSGEIREAKAKLKSGEAAIVVGTQAVAAESVAFADLALVIVDEEHRLGAKMKETVKALAPHHLALSATPIPRTLQGALVGVQDVSVLASPPARRRAVRTILAPFDAATVETALRKEKRRGGQSFVVVPRIEEVEGIKALLAKHVPDLSVAVAHGDLEADEIDATMVRFAEGKADVLLATTLIESGLDVPRANTMLVCGAEMFGLAQLHQLRGRVGRGRTQGVVYLFAPQDDTLAKTTSDRLAALLAADRLGAGFALSARDLDLRGGGDLVGDEQAGHMRLIGAALYQHLLERAVRAAKREAGDQTPLKDRRPPEMKLAASASIPARYVPDETLRIELYARFAALANEEAIDEMHEEMLDRFGPLPDETVQLLAARRLALLAERAGVTGVAMGPKATALSFTPADCARAQSLDVPDAAHWKERRLIVDAGEREPLGELERVLSELVPEG